MGRSLRDLIDSPGRGPSVNPLVDRGTERDGFSTVTKLSSCFETDTCGRVSWVKTVVLAGTSGLRPLSDKFL